MTGCCVDDCGLTADDNVILFEFPTSRLQRKRWLDAINPRSKVGDEARICSRHFARGDYEEVRGKTRLRGKVVPSRFGEQMDSQEESSPETEKESNKEENTSKNNHNDNHNDKSHNDFDKSHNDLDKSHNDSDNSDNSEKSDSDTDYDIKPRKRKRGRPKRSKSTKNKSLKLTFNKRKINVSDNKKPDNNVLDNSNNDKDKTTEDNHNDKSHNDTVEPDNQIENNDKDNCIKSIENGHTSENNFHSRERDKSPSSSMPADIEDIISKYKIENKKTERQLAAMAQELLMQAAEPVFIEMQVSQGPQEPPSNDCLMVLESVQVEVDPTLMLEARAEDEECMEQIDLDVDSADEPDPKADKKPDQEISLLTSSDEDDVIIQEPKIDTVEVSDETDEDDVPLVKLVKTEKKTTKQGKKKKRAMISQILWKGSQDVYCFECRHISANRSEHKKHLQTHSKVIQICQDCGFTTCSKSQLYRHRRKHKNDKKHKCPLCNYSARHNMSLIYHIKTHKNTEKEVYMCSNCDFVSPVKSVVTKHKQGCTGSRYSCLSCEFTSESQDDVRIHEERLHQNSRRKQSNDSNSIHSLDDDSTNAEDDD